VIQSGKPFEGQDAVLRALARPDTRLAQRPGSPVWWVVTKGTPAFLGIGLNRAMDLWRQGFIENQAAPSMSPEEGGDFHINDAGRKAAGNPS